MNGENDVLGTEDRFFASLARGDGETLEGLLAPDFLLIDVFTGSDVGRSAFVEVIGSRQLMLESITRLGTQTRLYGGVAVVTGQTRLVGHFRAQAFQVRSRYTHVYVRSREGYRLVNAQGTPVAASTAPSNLTLSTGP